MRRGEGRDGLPCLAELRQLIAETEIAKRMARDAPPMPVSNVSVIDDDFEKQTGRWAGRDPEKP